MIAQTFVRRTIGTSLFLAAFLAAAPAFAQGPYVIVGGDVTHRERSAESSTTYTDWKVGWGFNAAGGYQTKTGLAVEGEYSLFNNASRVTASDVTGPAPGVGHVHLNMFFANGRYTVPIPGPVSVYFGGGLGGYKSTLYGLSNTIAQSFGFAANGTNDGVVFAYQLRAGATLKFGKHFGVLAGYRYVHGNDLLFKGTAFGDLTPNGAKLHCFDFNLKIGF